MIQVISGLRCLVRNGKWKWDTIIWSSIADLRCLLKSVIFGWLLFLNVICAIHCLDVN